MSILGIVLIGAGVIIIALIAVTWLLLHTVSTFDKMSGMDM